MFHTLQINRLVLLVNFTYEIYHFQKQYKEITGR